MRDNNLAFLTSILFRIVDKMRNMYSKLAQVYYGCSYFFNLVNLYTVSQFYTTDTIIPSNAALHSRAISVYMDISLIV